MGKFLYGLIVLFASVFLVLLIFFNAIFVANTIIKVFPVLIVAILVILGATTWRRATHIEYAFEPACHFVDN